MKHKQRTLAQKNAQMMRTRRNNKKKYEKLISENPDSPHKKAWEKFIAE